MAWSTRIFVASLFALLGVTAHAWCTPVILDDFSLPPSPGHFVNSGSLTGSFPSVPGVGTFGATRNLSYTGTNPGTGNTWVTNFEALGVNSGSFPGQLAFATQTSAVEVTLNYSSFGILDLTGFGSIDFVFNPVFDPGVGPPFIIEVVLTTTSGTLTTSGLPVPLPPAGGIFSIPFSGFSGPGSLSAVTGITIALNNGGSPSTAADFVLDEIRFSIIPEPGTMALFGLGLLGVVGVTLRRRFFSTRLAA
jgi:hypothetical protein